MAKKDILSEERKELRNEIDDLGYLFDVATGRKQDIKGRFKLLTDPETPETSTTLQNPGEIDFVSGSIYMGNNFIELEPFREIAITHCRTKLSYKATSIEAFIRSFQATNDQKRTMLPVGFLQNISSKIKGDKD